MNWKDGMRSMSPEEIEDYLCGIVENAEKDGDRLKALELLAKVKGIIKHGNTEKKDFREVVIGGERESKAGESADER